MDGRDAEAAVLALIGQLDDAGDRDIDALVIEQRDLQQQRNTVQAQIKKAKRVRKRVLEKTKVLSDSDLVRELAARSKARAKAKAKAAH